MAVALNGRKMLSDWNSVAFEGIRIADPALVARIIFNGKLPLEDEDRLRQHRVLGEVEQDTLLSLPQTGFCFWLMEGNEFAAGRECMFKEYDQRQADIWLLIEVFDSDVGSDGLRLFRLTLRGTPVSYPPTGRQRVYRIQDATWICEPSRSPDFDKRDRRTTSGQ